MAEDDWSRYCLEAEAWIAKARADLPNPLDRASLAGWMKDDEIGRQWNAPPAAAELRHRLQAFLADARSELGTERAAMLDDMIADGLKHDGPPAR